MELGKKRISWIDTAKGMLIILVILGHNLKNLTCHMFINSFHMAAFFMLSGFTFKVSDSVEIFMWKKCKSLLVPYFVFAIIMLTYQFVKTFIFPEAMFDLNSGLISIFIPIGGKDSTTVYGLWFLPCLFLAEIETYIIIKLWGRTKVMGIIAFMGVIVLGVGIYLLLSRSSVFAILPIATIFILLGYIFEEKQMFLNKNWGLLLLTLLFFFTTTSLNWRLSKVSTVDLSHVVLGIWPLYLLSSLFGSIAICQIAMVVQRCKLLEFLGQDSLFYYGLHYEVVGIVGKIVPGAILRTTVTFAILCPVIQLYKNYKAILLKTRKVN